MTNRVRRDGGWARKSLSEGSRDWRKCLARRSWVLADAGLRTPAGHYDESTDEILFPWIDGVPGRRYFRDQVDRAGRADLSGGWQGIAPAFFSTALDPLVQLHQVKIRGSESEELRLVPFDPWLKIAPRLDTLGPESGALSTEALRAAGGRFRAHFTATMDRLKASGLVPVHGDFHVGQLLFDSSGAQAWLLDLEHLALGDPESDIGNFIAHLITSDDLFGGEPLQAFADLADLLPGLYANCGGGRLEPALIRAYGALALFRRLLKLREIGHGGPRLALYLSTAQDLLDR